MQRLLDGAPRARPQAWNDANASEGCACGVLCPICRGLIFVVQGNTNMWLCKSRYVSRK